jgi:hypothetical protein
VTLFEFDLSIMLIKTVVQKKLLGKEGLKLTIGKLQVHELDQNTNKSVIKDPFPEYVVNSNIYKCNVREMRT